MTQWHQQTTNDVLSALDTAVDTGLSTDGIDQRQAKYGANELPESGGRGPGRILWEQLCSAMVGLLVAAACVSIYLHEYVDAIAVIAIIVLNTALGFFQDYRAERALAALGRLSVPTVKVRRNGVLQELPAKQLVPGDIVVLEAGHRVPGDCRILESVNLRIQEASLTGESAPVEKQVDALPAEQSALGDRHNMAFMGTLIAYGHGLGVVVETGSRTQLGQIARSLQTVAREATPLQRRLAQLGRTLALVSLAIVSIVFLLGVMSGVDAQRMVMTSLSLAVAIVPEGLPAVATVALAIGARRMFQRKALIRKLPAVETLGSVTVICSDKTGTLTENQMTVTIVDVDGQRVVLGESSKETDGDDAVDRVNAPSEEQLANNSAVALLLAGGALCNDAELPGERDDEREMPEQVIGEPTEAALIVAAARMHLSKSELNEQFVRIGEIPFDSDRKCMTTVHRIEAASDQVLNSPLATSLRSTLDGVAYVQFTKGAVDVVLGACEFTWSSNEARAINESVRQRIMASHNELASRGMRLLGVAVRFWDAPPEQFVESLIERELIFVGMLAMIDPARPEASRAVARCRSAGIRPIMITGDHKLTASHISKELGIAESDQVVAGPELADLSAEDLRETAENVSVFARVSPHDKLRIVEALQHRGHVVAMTGDGVNDAPALKKAHIGIAMGRIGTDVSKEAADMVLLDDNFATIVDAVEEGRIVYDNIRKFVRYTMTSNAGEVWVMVLGPLPFLQMPLPLLPLQILWVNLVTDGLPGLALAVEPAEQNTMRRPPYPPSDHIMGRGMWRDIAWIGLLIGAVSLAMGYWGKSRGASEEHWRTLVFTVLTFSQMGNALAVRSQRDSLFRIGFLSNKALLGSVMLTFLLQLAVIYVPSMQHVFKTTSLTFPELLACLLVSSVVFWAIEAAKLVARWSGRRSRAP